MSTGGVFKLIANDGLQSMILTASDVLNARLREIRSKNHRDLAAKIGIQNLRGMKAASWEPTLEQIERSHVLVVNSSFKPFVSAGFEYLKVMSQPGLSLGSTYEFRIPQVGQFFSDMVLHIKLKHLAAKNAVDKVRYVAYPGHKIIRKATFKINTSIIDEIDKHDYNAYYQFKVPASKKLGWDRCVGQETPFHGHYTPDPLTDEFSVYTQIGDGNQTFKRSHPEIDLWIPVIMWFKEARQAFPQLVVPDGRTKLIVELASAVEMVSFADYGGGGGYVEPIVTTCDLYVNNIFLQPEMHDIFMKNFGFSLIRVHRRQIETLKSSEGSILMKGIKWPVECMYVGFRPNANLLNSQLWYKHQVLEKRDIPIPVIVNNTTLGINKITYYKEVPVVDVLKVQAHGIDIFKETPCTFFNSYLPSQFGKRISTPSDPGWHMINYGFTPGEYQPMGYLNVSRAREFYLSYRATSDEANAAFADGVDLIALADCINFLVVKDGSAHLKFST